MKMRSAMIEKDVAPVCLVEPSAPWAWVWKVKFLQGAVVCSQAAYNTEDEAWDAAGDYVNGVTA
jgi:hypothetical protein